MFSQTISRPLTARRRARRGQSIVVALLVLLLLGLAGALFVTIIAKNVLNARHASRVITADQYARAGITFADAQLANSLDGADWRPPLQFKLLNPPTETRELARYTAAAAGLAAPDPNDPDARYLEAGFARYNTGAGRFLLRVTYAPVLLKDAASGSFYDPVTQKDATGALLPVAAAPGKYLKIESIGREGLIDPQDPTTFTNNRTSDRLQAYQVAYKPIGITDYARFETNPDNRSETVNLGVTSRFYAQDTDGGIATPGVYDFNTASSSGATLSQYAVLTTYGAPDAFTTVGGLLVPNPNAGGRSTIPAGGTTLPGGGSFHSNFPVRFFGKNVFYLNNAGANAPLYQDGIEVAGDLLLNGYTQANPLFTKTGGTGQSASLEINPQDLSNLTATATPNTTPPLNVFVVPSNDTGGPNGGFSTQNGLVRDGSGQTDINGQPRGIGRLDPPKMDAQEAATRLPRYKALAMLSPPRIDPKTGLPYTTAGAGQYGYGQSIYINNAGDIQQNSRSIGGGSTLVDQWMNRTPASAGDNKGGWNGDFYEPPGVNITLGRQAVDPARTGTPKSTFGLRMTLFSSDLSKPVTWANPDGTPGTDTTKTVLFDDLNASNDPAAAPTATSSNLDNDVLIYAEGNVRVHGIASADPKDPDTTLTIPDKLPRHITIVTNGTAYIEGSLLKGNPDSSITVLAHDYVCVNTTQFLAGPQSDDNALGTPPPFAGDNDFLTLGSDETRLIQEFTAGLPNSGTPLAAYGTGSPLGLYVSARSQGGSGATLADFDIVNPATGLSIRQGSPLPFQPDTAAGNNTSIVSLPFGTADASSTGFGQQYFNLSNVVDNSLTTAPNFSTLTQSDTRLLVTRRGIGADDAPAVQDLELQRVAILPMDIRIEAVLYAQTGSFFVIPGPWFNSNPGDTLDAFAPTVTSTTPNGLRTGGADLHFPFYGQPIDMKITISGAVSEAQPADVANQTAWMLKWGWIPQYHGYAPQSPSPGTTPESSGHPLLSSAGAPASRPGIGLQIIYNPQASYPYNPGDGTALNPAHYLRSDVYGRPLPFSPKLPVSTGLLFAGESSEPPLLQ